MLAAKARHIPTTIAHSRAASMPIVPLSNRNSAATGPNRIGQWMRYSGNDSLERATSPGFDSRLRAASRWMRPTSTRIAPKVFCCIGAN